MSSFIEFNDELLNLAKVVFFVKDYETKWCEDKEGEVAYKSYYTIEALDIERRPISREEFECEQDRDKRYEELKGKYLV